MKTNRFLLGIFALAALAAACDEDEDLALPAMSTDQTTLYFDQNGGAALAQSLYITSNRDWNASCSADWVVITPTSGKASEKAVEVTVYVDANTGTDRTATIEFVSTTITTEVKVSQTGPAGSVESTYVYSNDFDKEASSQSYGSSGSSWPYLDQFDGWKNAEGSGISTVSYNYNNLSVRNNSNSNGNYSEYDGSGTNNLFFGSVTNYFVIQNITLPEGTTNYSLSFGSEKYLMDGSSVYDHDEFHVYLSDDGSRWVEISYTFPNGDRDALWDYATSTFTLPSGTESLYIYFTADVASAYRLDDVLLATNFEDGTSINFSTGITDLPGGGEGTGGGDEGGDYVYHNNFDKSAATQTYGSGSSWPYLDQFDGWKNAEGSGISTVSYNYNNVSARNNSNSNGSYSNYSGSGTNNLFFGSTTNYFVIQNITLPSGTDYTLSFGSEKYLSGSSSVFSHTEFHVYLSNDGDKWVELSYTFPNGDPDATWDEASTTFTLPSGTESLYIYYTSDVASAYRIDDVKLTESSTSGTSIDFSNGIELPGGGEGTGGGDEGGDHDLVGDGTADNPYTAADALWLANSGNYTDDEVYVKGIISQIDEISTSYGNATYHISDDGKTTEQFEIYRGYSLDGAKFTSSTEIEVGDKVVVLGVITMYYSTPEMTTGSKIVSLEKGDGGSGGGDEGGGDDEGDLVYGNDFDASVVSSNTTITSSVTAYQNETGSGASNVSYNWSSKMSVRVSNGSAGAYTNASGNNNIFFGAEDAGYFVIKNIALPSGETNYKLTFGAREDSNVFAAGTFKLYVSEDNAAWVQLTYDFPGGNTSSGSWALASTTFTVPSGTSTLYIYYEADVQSVYRIDDMRLTVSDVAGTSIDFSTGVSLVGGDSGEGGGDEGGDTPDTDGDGTVNNPYSASEALAIINAGTYTSSSVYIKGIISKIDEISTSFGNATYYISDDGTTSNQLEVYRGYSLGGEKFTSEDEIKVGDEVIVYGVLTMYGSTPEVTTGSSIYSLNGQTYEAPDYDDDDPFAQNVTWTVSSGNHSSNDKAYINGSADTYDLLKLGTSSAVGNATCTVPAGTKALHFYCIVWNNGGPAPFTVTVGSTAYDSYTATAHSGLANSSPYTITDITDSDYFEITFNELSADTEVKVETTNGSYPRVGFIGFKYITD